MQRCARKNKNPAMGAKTKNYSYLAPDFALRVVAKRYNGEVTEWFKERAWKVRTPQKGVEGSNPSLSAPKIF